MTETNFPGVVWGHYLSQCSESSGKVCWEYGIKGLLLECMYGRSFVNPPDDWWSMSLVLSFFHIQWANVGQ